MNHTLKTTLLIIVTLGGIHFSTAQKGEKIPIIIDTDANNEIDDQHALAYALFNQDVFNIKGITVNATYNGGNINKHYEEAKRVLDLCEDKSNIPVIIGADKDFETIKNSLNASSFDGKEAVDFIIKEALKNEEEKLVIIAIGKLTNIALAVKKNPEISKHIRLVWLGSNYPEPGEYNLENDIPAMNYLLRDTIPFEIVTVRYGKANGTDAVKITKAQAAEKIKGYGPIVSTSVAGRHGNEFDRFGDYAMDLYHHIDYYGHPPSRSLFDMAAIAIVKNPSWAGSKTLSGIEMRGEKWIQSDQNSREILLWENFEKEAILNDFFDTLKDVSK
ncbi:nucleoside hydrolase [Lutimonas sp.]|uniref:nucleoside hydrolase n=1 Tax=Lutimonas sp. TaxID=1872403 RepID=UPI003D9B790B